MTALQQLRAAQRNELIFQSEIDEHDFLTHTPLRRAQHDLQVGLSPYELALLRQITERTS